MIRRPRVIQVKKITELGAQEERFIADCFKGIMNVTVSDMIEENKPGLLDRIRYRFKKAFK